MHALHYFLEFSHSIIFNEAFSLKNDFTCFAEP